MSEKLALSVENLVVSRASETVRLVDDVSLSVSRGEIVGIAGESGSGKSLTLKAIANLLPLGLERAGDIRVNGRAGMVFQEPYKALNPTMRIGDHLREALIASKETNKKDLRADIEDALAAVGFPDPARQRRLWPHELSGGLRQRAVIAIALATNPTVLLCDEPTTALDVSIQDQILGLLLTLRKERGMAIVLVTHDIAVLAEVCDRVNVMYAGQIVESGGLDDVLSHPAHRYTGALLRAVPSIEARTARLEGIGGEPPAPADFSASCRFLDRCNFSVDACSLPSFRSVLAIEGRHVTSCINPPGGAQ
jgi:oligopeptide/dipeptide ABC transporter ATP-binding protein